VWEGHKTIHLKLGYLCQKMRLVVHGTYMDWIDLTQDRGKWPALMNPFMKLLVPKDDEYFLISFENISFSRRHSSMEYFHIQDVFDEQLDTSTYDIT